MKACEPLKIKNVWWKRLFQCILLCSFFINNSTYAQDKISRTGWYMGFSFGGGQIEYKNSNVRVSDHSFILDIQGGIALQNSVIGLEFNDQIIKDDEKHQESEDIYNLLCFLNLFPFHNSPFYITCGAGIGEHEKKTRYYYEDYDDKGRVGFLGCGYEFQVNRAFLAPEFRYYKGDLSEEDYGIAEIRLSLHAYFNCKRSVNRIFTGEK